MAKNYDFKNLTKTQKACLSLVESLGIYELRALARVFGDSAPTTLKRNDHINIIMNKIISGEELQPIPLRQGRPYKELSNIEGILNELSDLTGKDYNTLKSNQIKTSSPAPKIVIFRQFEQDIVNKKMFPLEVRGVVCKDEVSNQLYFINQDNGKQVLVNKNDVRLKPFDYVTGTAVIMNEEKEYALDTIKTVNYQTVASYHEIIDEYLNALPEKTIQIENKELLLGTRYLLKGKLLENENYTKNLIKTLRENKIVSVAFISNVLNEDILSIKNLGFNNAFLVKYDDKPAKVYEALVLFIEHIKRLQQLGMNVAVFIEDITTISSLLDFSTKTTDRTLFGHAETTVDIVKELVMLAKAGVNNKHTTLFTAYDEADMLDQTFISSVYKVSKKIN